MCCDGVGLCWMRPLIGFLQASMEAFLVSAGVGLGLISVVDLHCQRLRIPKVQSPKARSPEALKPL